MTYKSLIVLTPSDRSTRTTPSDNTLTTKAVADKLGTDAKTLRVFLRATSKGLGPGARYDFTAKDVPTLKAKFTKWANERAAAKAAKDAAPEKATKPASADNTNDEAKAS